jgi:hypothetical protein
MRKALASCFATVFAFAALAGTASAQPNQDGLVNVVIDDSFNDLLDVTITDVNVGVAAQIAANVCGLKVGPVAVLGRAVDRSGDTEVVCNTATQQIRLVQN